MKLFVWTWLAKVSDYYHSEGGLLVVAENLEHATELAQKDPNIVVNGEPDHVYELAPNTGEYRVLVFPDAGCC